MIKNVRTFYIWISPALSIRSNPLHKLRSYSAQRELLNWIESLFSGRSQRMHIDGHFLPTWRVAMARVRFSGPCFCPIYKLFIYLFIYLFIIIYKPRDHITSALQELHWLPIRQRIEYKLCLLVHLSIDDQAPSYLRQKLTFVFDLPGRRSLGSAQTRNLVIPRTKLKLGERAFDVAAPTPWNNLPEDIKCSPSTEIFKKKLKTFLFRSAYCN